MAVVINRFKLIISEFKHFFYVILSHNINNIFRNKLNCCYYIIGNNYLYTYFMFFLKNNITFVIMISFNKNFLFNGLKIFKKNNYFEKC